MCDKSYKNRQDLSQHKQNHSKKITYNCEQCSKSFTRRDSLNHHKKLCIKITQEKICKICNCEFPYPWNLKRHMVQKHTDKEEQKCNKCGKKYTHQTFHLSHVSKCNVNSSKGEAKTSTEDASFVEQQNITSTKQEHAADLGLFSLSYFHEDLQSDPYEVP